MTPKPQKLPAPADSRPPTSAPWVPDVRWHLKVLGGIYLFLIVVYFGLTAFLSRLPAPYGLRDIPAEMTPWLNK